MIRLYFDIEVVSWQGFHMLKEVRFQVDHDHKWRVAS